MKSSVLLTPPASEPVSLDELKAHARISGNLDDVLLGGLLKGARQWVEAYTRRALIAQTWALYLTGLPRTDRVALSRGPVIVVNKIQFFDEDDEGQEWGTENYYVNNAAVPAEIVLRSGSVWPDATRCANGIVIEYVAGYGANAESVPDEIKLAIRQLALHWYEHRGEASTSQTYAKAPLTIEALLAPYRILSLGASCA